MSKVKLLSAALITAATFATPVLAAEGMSHRVTNHAHASTVSPMRSTEGDTCIRAPRAGAFATEPWTDVAPCEPNTGY